VGQPAWWGPAGGGKGGYDRWAQAEKRKEKKENGFNSNLKLIFQIYSNLIQSKQDIPELRKFEINYGGKVFEIRRNVSYRNFLKFEMDFELKIMETSMG
jgi:hypothetical protein